MKPERTKLHTSEDGREVFYFCHGGSCLSKHVDCVMKTNQAIAENNLLNVCTNLKETAFVYPLRFVRAATQEEIDAYCI